MGVRRTFNQLHGLKDSVDDEKRRFVERVNRVIFREVDTTDARQFKYHRLFELLCFEVGADCDGLWRSAYRWEDNFHLAKDPPEIRSLTRNDFNVTLMVLMALFRIFQTTNEGKEDWLTDRVQLILSRSTCDLGVRWKDGLFYPSGPPELDTPLVEESLTWLDGYPNERKDYRKALEYYAAGDSLGDVVKNMLLCSRGNRKAGSEQL
jgi:hypothetical protein